MGLFFVHENLEFQSVLLTAVLRILYVPSDSDGGNAKLGTRTFFLLLDDLDRHVKFNRNSKGTMACA